MLTRNRVIIPILAAITLVGASGCVRERPSDNPPIHINPNMDNQPKYRPQSESKFFADGATMRVPPAGTVAQGDLRGDVEYFTGKNVGGEFVKTVPDTVSVTLPLLRQGQDRFNVYCSPCHGRVGDGKGIMVNRGYVPPPTFHSDRIRELPNGHLFAVITHGVRNMPAYMYQIPVDDRWAIVAYLRALQRSQNATKEDIPQTMQDKVR